MAEREVKLIQKSNSKSPVPGLKSVLTGVSIYDVEPTTKFPEAVPNSLLLVSVTAPP